MVDRRIVEKQEGGRNSQRGVGEVGDFFSPFFDVVFYKPAQAPGVIQTNLSNFVSSQLGFREDAEVAAFRERAARAETASQNEKRGTIGNSTIRLTAGSSGVSLFESIDRGEGIAGDLRDFRANLTIEARASAAYKATLTLQPPYSDALRIIDSHAIKFGSLMEIQWGYNNATGGEPVLSDKGLFSIVQPSVRFGRQITISVTGWDLLPMGASSIDRRCAWLREDYPTDFDVLAKLVERFGLRAEEGRVGSDSSLTKVKTGQPLVQATDDYTFFLQVLRSNDCSYEVVTDNQEQVLVISDQTRQDLLEPQYNLLWYEQPSSNVDIPMINFESNSLPSLFAAQGSRGYFSLSYSMDDATAKESLNKPEDQGGQVGETGLTDVQEAGFVGPAVATASAGAAKPYPANTDEGICASGKIWVVPDERPNQVNERDVKAKDNRRLANTRANVTIPGHPTINPLQIVCVRGVGKEFSGNYRVMKVVHDIGQGGYISKLDLLRATSTGDSASPAPTTKGEKRKPGCAAGSEPNQETVTPTKQRTSADGRIG